MYCRHCGKEIVENANFCSYCGMSLQKSGKTVETCRDNAGKNQMKFGWSVMEKILAVGLLLIIVVLGVVIVKANSIGGVWYLVDEGEGSAPEDYFNFMSDGTFKGDDASGGGTYGAQNGDLLLQYNPLLGSRTYKYEIKWGKLYLYKGSNTYVYSRVMPVRWREDTVTIIDIP